MISIGTTSTLILSIPANSERNWGTAIRTGCFQKLADHDHNGTTGTGKKLSPYLALDLTTSILTNDTWMLARNAANNGNLKILKVASNDLDIYLGDNATPSSTTTRIGSLMMKNNTFIQAVNAANTAAISIIKVNASDKVEIGSSNVSVLSGSTLAISGLSTIAGTTIIASDIREMNAPTSAVTLADNQVAAADTTITTALTTNKTIIVDYKIVRNSLVQRGTLTADYDTGSITNEFTGTTAGITFSFSSGLIKYTSTSTGQVPSLYFSSRRV